MRLSILRNGIRLIEDQKVRDALSPAVLARFREWMRITDSPTRERAYIEALQSVREKA